MLDLLWDTLEDLKSRLGTRLAAHSRNAQELQRLKERVWTLETEMKVVNVYQHNAQLAAPAPTPLRAVAPGELH